MDLFGQAFYDRFCGKIYPFFFEVGGEKSEFNLDRYFRDSSNLSKVENKLINMCYGDILDIGCGTGNYFPALEKKGHVIGIDISEKIIEVSKKMGIKNCFVADIFSYKSEKKFDTITMFENNLGMGSTVKGTKKLLKKISNILKDTGQLLIILSGRAKNKNYVEVEFVPIYHDIRGEKFKWISFNPKFLKKLCNEIKLEMKIISANRYYSFIKITKE
jgi:SAM-dependent methyltransferase